MFKYWRSRTGPLRFSFQLGKKVRRKKRRGKKKGRKQSQGLFSFVLVQLNQGEKWGVVQAPFFFFFPHSTQFLLLFLIGLYRDQTVGFICILYIFCCTIKTASHLHLLDYTEISDYLTERKASNCEVSFFSFLPLKRVS